VKHIADVAGDNAENNLASSDQSNDALQNYSGATAQVAAHMRMRSSVRAAQALRAGRTRNM